MTSAAPSHDLGRTDTPLLEETIGALLDRVAALDPAKEALVSRHQGLRYTYGELAAAVDGMARAMLRAGLRKGDRLGIWSPNYAEWTLVQFATAKIGVILVNLNPAYRTSEVEYALNQSGCRWLVAAPSFKTSDYTAMIAEVRPNLSTLERELYFWSDEWDAFVASGEAPDDGELAATAAALHPDDPINIQYTSGTTGFPKGATLTHRNILNNGYFVGVGCGYSSADRVCIPVPFYHCFGMVMGNLGAVTHGATMVIPADAFEPGAVLQTVQDERCTSLYGVPTMFIAELAHPEFDRFDLTSLRTGILAGSPCPVEVMKQTIERMHMSEVTICYGMTETSPVSTQTLADDDIDRRTGTVGRVHPHVEIKIVDPATGQTVPHGTAGEFCTRGYSVMQGYWNDPTRTADAIDAHGFMHTGDLATMDEAGYVNIVGRIKDMVIRGGENVYPREIEEFLYSHPAVADVQVIGVPDQRYGEEIMAWIRLKDGAAATEDEIKDFCRGRIAHYKIPRYVKFVDEFPMTVTGKVQKFLMRDAAKEELGLDEVSTA
ncbi:MAG: AMP-binding protein [Acidimicrobiales bacterium]|nr:AMP-binding protein [Acidimicrobiales bacterium]